MEHSLTATEAARLIDWLKAHGMTEPQGFSSRANKIDSPTVTTPQGA